MELLIAKKNAITKNIATANTFLSTIPTNLPAAIDL